MRRLNRSFNLVLLGLGLILPSAANAASTPTPLAEGWSRWQVAVQPGHSAPCCWQVDGGAVPRERGCTLDAEAGGSASIISDDRQQAGDEVLSVFVLMREGQLQRVHAFGSDCPVQLSAPLQEINGWETTASVAWLQAQLPAADRSLTDAVLMTLAFHAGPEATQALITAAAADTPRATREQALFWLGQARGPEGLPTVLQVASDDASIKLRQHALFVLAQSPLPAARQALRERTQRDASHKVRGQGLFWLAQVGDVEALSIALAWLADDVQSALHDEAIFALSQLPDGRADDALIGIVEGDYSRQVKKQAMFWLAQSDSDKALGFLDRLILDQG